jgi:hypothetical protein
MNCLKLLSKDNPILTDLPLKSLLYVTLVSKAYAQDEWLVSSYDYDDIFRFLPFGGDSIEDSFQELISEKLIEFDEDTNLIYIGYVTQDGQKKLYTGTGLVDIEYELSPVVEAAEDYIAACKSKIGKGTAQALLKEVKSFIEKPLSTLNVPALVDFFGDCYHIFMQEEHRNFQQKEYGQMKNLTKLYDNVTVVRLIIRFFTNLHQFTDTPSIGNLLYAKDKVYTSLTGGKKAKVNYKDDEDF